MTQFYGKTSEYVSGAYLYVKMKNEIETEVQREIYRQ